MQRPKHRPNVPILAALAAAALAACAPGDDGPRLSPEQRAALAAADSLAAAAEEALAPLPLLDADTRGELRRHLNARHVASARQHGVGAVRDSGEVARLAAAGDLVRLQDSTAHWIVRELDYSLPFLTPDARAMLVEIGERFHQRLDSLRIPRYRFEITSVLRTAALQSELRQGNPNASRTTSSHEFGTTLDIAYNGFSPPAPAAPQLRALRQRVADDPAVAVLAVERARAALEGVAEERTGELKAVLAEVLREMQQEGKLRALHERAQPVFHITVAREYPAPPRPAAE